MFDTLADTFLTLWDQKVRATPETTAVIGQNGSLTYGELNERAKALAIVLTQYAIPPETPIALYFDRDDILSVVALIGILKAGFAYLPLEPNHPQTRVNYMLMDAKVQWVVSTTHRSRTLPPTTAEIITLDTLTAPRAEQDLPYPDLLQLAYVLYTSGSTGTPKGVMVTHGGLVNYVRWASRAYDIANGYGAPVHSPLTFDLTITSLLVPLISGRTVHLLPEMVGAEALRRALLERDDWSVVKLTPAHLDLLRTTIPLETFRTRRHTFVIGGEALTYAQTAPWHAACPSIRLINEYGPTETVVGCCIYEVPSNGGEESVVPIGQAIVNTQLYILDETFQRIPPGTIGELYIGGAGVARGYLNRPSLTAERFTPNPFGPAGSRLYRSGDLARERADGLLEFCGRADEQLKILGYRIEPAEIETALVRHPTVREAVVIAIPTSTSKQLVAYIVPHADGVDVSDLQQYLHTLLPAYMVPHHFVSLPQLPLSLNGKIDRTLLPPPVTVASETLALPTSPIESLLYGIWEEVLGHSNFGVDSDFFALGGDSLAAGQVIARLRAQLEIEIRLPDFFQHPMLRSLALVVEQVLFAELEAFDVADAPQHDYPSTFGADV